MVAIWDQDTESRDESDRGPYDKGDPSPMAVARVVATKKSTPLMRPWSFLIGLPPKTTAHLSCGWNLSSTSHSFPI